MGLHWLLVDTPRGEARDGFADCRESGSSPDLARIRLVDRLFLLGHKCGILFGLLERFRS